MSVQEFLDQVGYENLYASSGNKHFFTKSHRCQTYQNYEQPPWTSQNSYLQSHFSVLKIGRIFPKKKFYEEYLTSWPIFKTLYFLKLFPIFVGSVHNFVSLTITLFSEKILVCNRCIRGLMPSLIRKSYILCLHQ